MLKKINYSMRKKGKTSELDMDLVSKNALNRPDIFDLLSEKELAIIEKTRYEVFFKAGEIIFKRGSKTSQFMFLSTGLAKSYLEGFGDKNLIIRLIKPNEIMGVLASYVDGAHHFSVMAVEDSKCIFFDLDTYREIARKNFKVYDKLTENLCKHSMQYFSKFISLTQKHVNGRIAETILYLYKEIYKTNPIKLTITKHDIADMTGMSKDTAVRVLKALDLEKIIKLYDNTIHILDIKKLEKICDIG